MRIVLRAALAAMAVCGSITSHAQQAVPDFLREWEGWVLRGEEFRRCPFLASATQQPGRPIDAGAFRCGWPERLSLDVDARGGRFSQRWQVYAESWVELPGDTERWPRDVRVNGQPAAVVAIGNVPNLRLAPGTHAISGRFEWSARPEALPLPKSTAIIDLAVDGQRVAQPERPDGAVWLGKRRSAEQAAAMEVQVYRLVTDDIPVRLATRIRLNVAGDAREELLARVLPEGFTPLNLQGALPARLERDGTLRIQVRPGSHEITLHARGATVAGALARPTVAGGTWARDEIWSFASRDDLRVAAAEGAEGIDPAQANVPPEWREYPAFRMGAEDKLTVVERSRGLANADDNRLSLDRQIWLDFSHEGFTAVDTIRGKLRRDWRLDMRAPFRLASATENGQQLLVTEGADGEAGLELRTPDLALTTVARKAGGGGAMPATGWDNRFERVDGTLNLPPGHRLIAAIGADFVYGSWWENWGLWNVFGVLLIVVFVHWTAGRVLAAIAAVALLLTYQEAPEYIWLWGNLLAALAIARAAPEGRFQRIARGYRSASFIVLGLALLPFLWSQVRVALYPQLEGSLSYGLMSQPEHLRAPREYPEGAAATDAAAAASDAASPAIEADIVEEQPYALESDVAMAKAGINTMQVIQRYAAGTVLQAGPGIPDWHFQSYRYGWSGPVEAADTVRFVFVGPITLFFWRLIGVITLVVLFGWLAMLSFGGQWPPRMRAPKAPGVPGATTAVAAAVVLLAAGLGASTPASAQAPASPSTELLNELKARLTAAPTCAPHCADVAAARVAVDGDRLEVTLQVSALAPIAVAMPHASDRWQLDEVSVDGRGSLAMARERDASLWVPLTPGAHTVRLAGRLAAAESIPLAFPQTPRTIDLSTRGWTVSGVSEGRLVAGSLELVRERSAQRTGPELSAGSEFPAFVRVERVFNLDLDWTVDTQVSRVAPQRAAVSVEIPLVTGESVLTPGIEVRNGAAALVGLAAGQARAGWRSGLPRSETIELTMPEDAARGEIWSFVVNPQWNVSFEGFPPVLPEDVNGPVWVFRFTPRPGEKLVARVTRPRPAGGTTLAIDSVSLTTSVGKRSSDSRLEFNYRSTQGGRHVIKLPEGARVTAVTFDHSSVQLRPEEGELPLALTPGSHNVVVVWEESRDVGLRTNRGGVDLRTPASNIRQEVTLPDSRWPLFASGPGVGPAFLYWGELAVFVAIAWLLGRWSRSPLRFPEWLLLGLGLSTQSWWVFSLTAAWLIVMRWREGWQLSAAMRAWRFNSMQVLLALFTFIVITTLVFSGIRNGLLSAPDMGVTGMNSYGNSFNWFQDQTTGVLNAPAVYSVPMWIYRLLFFAWASWMALALVRWLRWAFNAWKSGGLWKGGEKVPV